VPSEQRLRRLFSLLLLVLSFLLSFSILHFLLLLLLSLHWICLLQKPVQPWIAFVVVIAPLR
jgi:hypothetical protein